ncbi:hypothetical protein ECTPHS_05896 [Ectothiorhodospira sp. PHS-1]|nr:hypothetical protein ECTPHS_05896 [Ectothiorhodospira sp. PHS-1]
MAHQPPQIQHVFDVAIRLMGKARCQLPGLVHQVAQQIRRSVFRGRQPGLQQLEQVPQPKTGHGVAADEQASQPETVQMDSVGKDHLAGQGLIHAPAYPVDVPTLVLDGFTGDAVHLLRPLAPVTPLLGGTDQPALHLSHAIGPGHLDRVALFAER